jgi:nascent polypeptide-associated complex subunit alpha
MMKQMGMKMDELSDIETIILQSPKREIVIKGAAVTSINMQGQKMYQITGGTATETKKEPELDIPEEDVLLVAQQANVSVDRARATLEDAQGDLARAILILSTG